MVEGKQVMRDQLSPSEKARKTASWARIMTKWLITKASKADVRWRFVEFGGPTGSESRGIVDILAMRKNHKTTQDGLKRGDLLDIVLIQVKGGSAQRPSENDIGRLRAVKKYHHARTVVLAEWKKGRELKLSELIGRKWIARTPSEVFK